MWSWLLYSSLLSILPAHTPIRIEELKLVKSCETLFFLSVDRGCVITFSIKQKKKMGDWEMSIEQPDGPSQSFILEEEHEMLFGPPAHKGCVIRLNVGGVPYVTTQSTLCSKGSNFFQSLLMNRMGNTIVRLILIYLETQNLFTLILG